MLDINDFIVARGGNPDKIKESQKRRGKPVEIVDQVIEAFEVQRAGIAPLPFSIDLY
jgi:seryl-tRNA synthetase